MTIKNRGLGRGLNALFEDEEVFQSQPAAVASSSAPAEQTQTPSGHRRQNIGVDQIIPGQFQPRTLFNDDSIAELSQSIKTHGLLQPIVVRALKDQSGRYEIIAGERRWRAAQKAQLHEVPTVVMDLTDEEALEIALVENLQREDLNPVDEAMGYKKLMNEFNHTQEKLAEVLGKSRSHVANMVRLLSLPDVVLAYLERGDLSMGHARALVTASKPESLAKEVVSKNLSVRETERLVAQAEGRPSKSKTSSSAAPGLKTKDVDTLALEKDVSNALGMRVTIDSGDGKSGKVTIEFKSLDQLDEVIKKLSASRSNF